MSKKREPNHNTITVPPAPAFAAHLYANFNDMLVGHDDPFIHSGLFSVNEGKLSKENCRKVSSLLFDCDIKHAVRNNVELNEQCRREYAERYAEDADALSRLDDPNFNATEKVIMELWSAEKVAEVAKLFIEPAVTNLQRWLGKPNKILCTGNGVHVHYWLEDGEGWDAIAASSLAGEEVRANRDGYIDLGKALVAYVNKQCGFELFDPSVTANIGSRKCREVNTLNTKSANNVKRTFFTMDYLCDADARFNMDSCTFYAEMQAEKAQGKTTSKFAESVANAGGSTHHRLSATTTLLVQNEQCNAVVEITVDELFERLKKLPKQSNGKAATLKCRPINSGVPLSHTGTPTIADLNSVVNINPEGILSIMCDVDAGKSYAVAPLFSMLNGRMRAYFVYDGTKFEVKRNPKTGAMYHTLDNYTQILRFDPALSGYIKYNLRKDTVFCNGLVNRGSGVATAFSQDSWRAMMDNDIYSINHYIEKTYSPTTPVKEELLNRAVELYAQSMSYDPVVEFVEQLQWDGVDRFGDTGGEGWINTILGNPSTAETYTLYNQYSAVIANSVVRNIFCLRASSGGQHLALFAGPQGCGKSYCSRIFGLTETLSGDGSIMKDYFKEDGVSMKHRDTKDTIMSLFGCFVIECPESVSASNDTTAQEIKAFLTTDTFQYRKPYAKKTSTGYKSTFIFTNSNDEVFLTDDTGNRRFLIVDCFRDMHHVTADGRKCLDIDWLRTNVAQIYAQAYQRVILGKNLPVGAETRKHNGKDVQNWNLPFSWASAQEKHNEMFMCETNLTVAVERATETLIRDMSKTRVSLEEIKKIVKAQSPNIGDAQLSNRLPPALRRSGWEQVRTKDGNRWDYTRPVKQESTTAGATAASSGGFSGFGFTQPISDTEPKTERRSKL